MKKIILYVAASLAVIFVVIQFVPVEGRENPPVESDIDAPAEVAAILRRSCYDCHSHETRWPWYSRVAPASWLVARDTVEAREHLNFSIWNQYNAEKKAHKLEEIWEEVESGEMPLWFYVPLHPESKLSEGDLAVLKDWSESAAEMQAVKADVEKAVGNLLNDSEKAFEEAAEGLIKASEKAMRAAQEALERASSELEDADEPGAEEEREDGDRDRDRVDNSGPGSANSGRDR